ncbi:MAG TPA: hypothetical protein VJ821_16390 [Anaerolineales bacterium]|nr:hypothetical protein [Anaerolineales bacterium]
MKYFTLIFMLCLTACTAATPLPTPTPIPTPTPRPVIFAEPRFIFQGDDPAIPIVTHNLSPEIQNLYINPGAVLFHEGQFHMFFNSFTAWPGLVKVGYMISDDGYDWQMAQDAPVLTTDQIPFGDGEADASSVVMLDDGTWVMYFHTISAGEIGRATAASPLGPWTVDAEPVLKPGPEGAWDQLGLEWPSVVKDEDEFRMYYGVKTAEGHAISFATSADGILWTKYNDPETTDEQFAESDPVLTKGIDWEYHRVDRPRVVKSPDGWVMIYQAGISVELRGLAVSNDGIHWEKYPENPIFNEDVFPIPNAKTWDTNLLYHDGTYYYFMELGTLNGTDLYLASHQGLLRK